MKASLSMPPATPARLKLAVRGAVQGVGFRPFVYQLATELHLLGWVNNSPAGVSIEVEGSREALVEFLNRIQSQRPANSYIQSLESLWLDPAGYQNFSIQPSVTAGGKSALVLPDIATCPECRREMLDPSNRRYRYPFTNCTHCGPRFSIITALPYDRANTSMRRFTMCARCQAEYDDPQNRRFHAQPNACPACGPHLELWNPNGEAILGGHDALQAAAQAICAGKIVAVKGIGGFHLMVDARNEAAVRRLRERKHREEKPFALLFPSLVAVQQVCEVDPLEARLLQSPEAPIVLLRSLKPENRSAQSAIAASAAPNNPNLGVMLPSNPLHHLLMTELAFPVVATSGNLNDEPICTDEDEALERLRGLADLFLVHDRPIVRHIDDSIVRVMAGREMVLRRARGYAPLPITIPASDETPFLAENETQLEPSHADRSETILAVGAHLKNSIALAIGEQVFVSQHIGDLETEPANRAFHQVIGDLKTLYESIPGAIVSDLHPDYLSSHFAAEQTLAPVFRVQHHVAHVLSCLVENAVPLPALGVAWDGTGYGSDGRIWGGEFFEVTTQDVEHIAHLRPFPLPGGDHAVREPRRAALGLLYEFFGNELFQRKDLPVVAQFPIHERTLLQTMLRRGLNSPLTSSIGRLFDGVAALIGLRQQTQFEGQAAMDLEFAIEAADVRSAYPLPLKPDGAALWLDWFPLLEAILEDVNRGISVETISARFHNALVEALVRFAKRSNQSRVILSGGCFQNRYLLERTVRRLREENFQPYWHQRVPTNDGGIALGQIEAARRILSATSKRRACERSEQVLNFA